MSEQGLPWPVGMLVRPIRYEGISKYLDCAEHVLEAYSEAQAVDYGCGWVQQMGCLVCRRITQPLSVTDFWEPATNDDLRAAIVYLDDFIDRAQTQRAELDARLEGKPRRVLRDFG